MPPEFYALQLITKCLARAEQTGAQERLRTIHDLDAAAIRLNLVCKVVLDPQCEDGKLRSIILKATPSQPWTKRRVRC